MLKYLYIRVFRIKGPKNHKIFRSNGVTALLVNEGKNTSVGVSLIGSKGQSVRIITLCVLLAWR